MNADDIKQRIEQLIAPHLPKIRAQIRQAAENAGQRAGRFVANDTAMEMTLSGIHSRLPPFLRLIIRRERFVQFCLRHRDRLFGEGHERR